ncbi:hypothetical protein LTR47_004379 [Exophiala xenobiotica]|nr:hypothetical protein LTR72_002835 [Exophiala xenobiotica]KAK5234346.1 hypothetical protein LTR47_004379 [Exophiala xenobiotica]KAK5254819.1 hypothetical protein LTS06_000958 [Exophiala xenobiotica]KAK5262036.1 hypothetical protein LTR40_001108 [Exophiala xenobiotica]KAK5300595.1 hypothetical protein LTR14_000992 [Exophiala xenobiotica]
MLRLTSYNIWIVLASALGAYSYGFSFAVFVTSIGEPGFFTFFKLDPASSKTASILGAISALFCAGAAFGAVLQGWTSDRFGRRISLAIGGAIAVVGTTVVAAAWNIPMLFVFRFITGLGVGQLLALVPLYIAEVAPPHRRGLLSAATGCSFSLGYLSSAWIGYGCFFTTNDVVQWRMPLCLCPIAPLGLVIACYWIPESPRWLIWNDRLDEAWVVIQRVHHDPSNPTDTAAHAEFIQIKAQVEHDKQFKATYLQMFTHPSWRRRTLLAILVIFAVGSAGINGITTYLILVAQSIGFTGSKALLLYGIYVIIAVGFNFVNAAVIDKVGRRPLLLIGLAWCSSCLLATSLLIWKFAETTNSAANKATIFFIMMYAFGVGMFIDPTQFVIVSEIFPTTIRAKGLTIALFTYFVTTILYTAGAPTAFANIGWRYYLVFVCVTVACIVALFFMLPETTGLTLEEIGALFGDEVVVHFAQDGHGLVEVDADAAFALKNETIHVEKIPGAKGQDQELLQGNKLLHESATERAPERM